MNRPVYYRSQLNAWMKEYSDTLPNGIELSVYDVMESEGQFDNVLIIEDVKEDI